MKNLMVANIHNESKWNGDSITLMLKAQIENSLEVGWKPDDMCVITNFDFEYQGVVGQKTDLNEHCFTGSKMFGVQWAIKNKIDDVFWAHDLDCWQGVWFDCPEFKDVGAAEYSLPKFNGGSIFWRGSAKDIVEEVIRQITKEKATKEEPTLNLVLKNSKYKNRVTVLNTTYNLGCSGFVVRYNRAIKPIRVSHFHPTNRIAWETHALDRNQLGHKSISNRLEKLIRRFYPDIATQLSETDPKNQGKRMVPPPTSE